MLRHDDLGGWSSWFAAAAMVAVSLAVSVPASVFAQSDGERDVDDETAKKVLKLLKSGKKAYKAENYQEAYDKFGKAYELWSRPPIQARLGKAAEKMGDDRKALEHYRAYLESKPEGDMADEVQAKAEALAEGLPALVTFESEPSGVTVRLGAKEGEKLGETPFEKEVEPGDTTFFFRSEEGETTNRSVTLEAGESRTVSVELQTGPKPQAFGEPIEPSETGQGTTEPTGGAFPAGAWGWGTGIAGLVGLGTGGAFTLLQSQQAQKASDLDRSSSTRTEFREARRAAQAHYRRSLIAYSVGASLTAVGVGLLLNHYLNSGSGGESTAHRLQLDLGVAGDGGWAGVRGEF